MRDVVALAAGGDGQTWDHDAGRIIAYAAKN